MTESQKSIESIHEPTITSENDKKKYIKITLYDTDGNEIEYEVKKHIPLKKILENYCETKKKNLGSMFLTIGGEPVDLLKNSEELGLDNGCEINVVSRQSGGFMVITYINK